MTVKAVRKRTIADWTPAARSYRTKQHENIAGSQLQEIMDRYNIGVRKVAEIVGVNRQTVKDVLNGKKRMYRDQYERLIIYVNRLMIKKTISEASENEKIELQSTVDRLFQENISG